ncbi:MAG: ribosome-binding factor A [Gemmatimonadaceae bacterium 4484_173]|nr:MAG: ribosome-binding factor A [Gemmatimonadaceae bacterium 4484_173]RKZ04116.1 MAG: 30S ribosome-binding factor RbfA [Candidatus Fermentibacteria bacterium]
MNPRRTQQIANRIQMLVSEILQREISDPRLNTLVVNRVELARDGSFARVYVSSYQTDIDADDVQKVLKKASGFIRKNLAGKLDMRIVPALRFQWDNSVKEGEEILSAIRKLNAEES